MLGPAPPVTFSLDGEPFRCVTALDLSIGPLLLSALSVSERGERVEHPASLSSLVVALVDPEDRDALLALLSRRVRPVPIRSLSDLVMWAVEALTGHPFPAARMLCAMAVDMGPLLRGRMLSRGVNIDGLGLRDLLDVTYAAVIDDAASGSSRVRAEIDKRLANTWRERTTWGTDRAAEVGARGMMELLTAPTETETP